MARFTYLTSTMLIAFIFAFITPVIHATMQPSVIETTCNALATLGFEIKDLVLTVATTQNSNGLIDVYEEFDDLFNSVLDDIELMTGSSVMQSQSDQQLVYEAYSNFVQSLFELTDSLSTSATVYVNLDSTTEYKIPASVRSLGGVVDAYFANLIGLFPANTSYTTQSNNQKGQVDTHFRQTVHAFHLVAAKTGGS
ncbi:MAG: hypothetical protein M1834_004971 [Cirrosporium novae-zelandiae]|nr:MAG: hypothetical protein M1834_004971 [Cirrosporium novae-zelandiae]